MLQRVQEKYGTRNDFVLVGVSVDSDRAALKKFLSAQTLNWPILFEDEKGLENSMARQFRIKVVPSLWVIDHTGHIAARYMREQELESKISELLPDQSVKRNENARYGR